MANAADTESGERGAHVEAEAAEHRQNTDTENKRFDDALTEQHERSGAGVSAGEGTVAHAAQRPAHNPPENPRDTDDEQDGSELEVIVAR